jgi:tRNA A37 N6-isopentenylltransferase MiaA
MFAAGLDDEVREALAGPVSSTAIHALGLRDVAELSQSDAMDALIRRTTRYAAYQRKWMRRIPGLIPLDASRPPEVVAERVIRILERRRAELARA